MGVGESSQRRGLCNDRAVTLKLRSGAIAIFDFSRRSGYGYDERIEVHGFDGMIESRRQRSFRF